MMNFTETELSMVLNSYEKQLNRMFKIILLLICTNLFFIYLYFKNPSNTFIDLMQKDTETSTQFVEN